MATTKAVWGIDIGQCALRALQVRAGGDGKVEVTNHVYLPHAKILSAPDADKPALIAEAMGKFSQEHDVSNDKLVVAVPGQHTLARFTKLPPVDKKKIPEIVKYEAQQQIPFDMEEVIWDYQVFEDEEAAETEVGIFAMRRDLLREHLHPFSNLNLEPAAVQSAPLALYNALKYDGQCGEESLCILDIGAQNTDLIVVDGNSLWTRNIPIGGNHFTEALLKTFKLSFRKAERLKRDAQKHKYARQIFQAMRPAFADLVAEVQRSVGFYTSSHRGVKLTRILAMGNAFRLPGMIKFIQQNLGMDVVRPTTFEKLAASDAPKAAELMDELMGFGVAYGLGLQGLDLAPITSSLLPPEIAKQVVWRKKTPWFYGAAACLAVAAATVWGVNLMDQGVVKAAQAEGPPPSLQVVYGDPENRTDPEPDPRAVQILNNGLTAPTPVGKAKQLEAVSSHFQQILSQIQDQNREKLAKANEILDLEAKKVVWPAILYKLHEALPEMDPDLADALAKGPEAYRQLIESNPEKYARGQRSQIFIESFDATFASDVEAAYQVETTKQKSGRSSSGSQSGGFRRGGSVGRPGGPASYGGPAKPGFVVTLKVRTPNEGGYDFLNRRFLAPLREQDSEDLFYFDKVETLTWGLLRERDSRGPATGGFSSNLAGNRGTSGSGIQVASTEDDDPVTGESMSNDWVFDVVVKVVLEPRPETADASGRPSGPPDADWPPR